MVYYFWSLAIAGPSKNALKDKIITLRRGLAIYQINASPYWYARIRLPNCKINIVRSTKETSRLDARKVAEELYELIMFMSHTFVRPIETELYGLKHRHIKIIDNPKSLLLTIQDGKTGFRHSNSMRGAVLVYKTIKERYPDLSGPDDYLFFPKYKNRDSAKRIAQRQFNALLKRCELKENPIFQYPHSLYSLRHTAICMRLVNSKGKVNIYTLAKNAGTSVNQIERFYARNLSISAELVRNLQSFGQ